MKKLILSATMGSLLLSGSVFAQDDRRQEMFDNLDSDRSGTVNYNEFEVFSAPMFELMDGDGNGELTLEEFIVSRRPPRPEPPAAPAGEEQDSARSARNGQMASRMEARFAEEFAQADTDGSGMLSTIEFTEFSFLQLDADNNGSLSVEELVRQGRGGPGGRPGPRRGNSGSN